MAETFSIFILKVSAASLKQPETFLKNRKWTVGVGTNLKEALAYIIQKQPEFVMIAADHPHKKVKVLPKILAQAFPVKIIAFTETSGTQAMNALNEMGQEYVLFPPVSGPAIERMVLKMKRDEEKRQKEREEREKQGLSPDASPDEVIRLKGAQGGKIEVSGGGAEQARAALQQMLSDNDSGDGAYVAKGDSGAGGPVGMGGGFGGGGMGGFGSSDGLSGDGNSVWQKGQGNLGQFGNHQHSGSGFGQNQSANQDGANNNAGSASQTGPSNEAQAAQQEGPVEGESYAEWEERMRKALANMSKAPAGAEVWDAEAEASNAPRKPFESSSPVGNDSEADPLSASEKEPFPEGSSRDPRKGPLIEYDPITGKKKVIPRYKSDSAKTKDNDSIIVKGTQAALDESVNLNDGSEMVNELDKSSHCACIIVESERFSGYLVAALGNDRKIDKSFMDMVRQKLFAFLKAHGEIVKDEQGMEVKLQEVEFEDWAIEHADFLRKSVHEGDEIAMAFFPTKETTLKLEESASENMLKVELGELKEDTIVEFDLYIYMPENNKYLLYTPQGKPLYGTQRSRLTDKGVTHMHLRKESASGVKKYRAQNFLNEKIAQFRQAKANGGGGGAPGDPNTSTSNGSGALSA